MLNLRELSNCFNKNMKNHIKLRRRVCKLSYWNDIVSYSRSKKQLNKKLIFYQFCTV